MRTAAASGAVGRRLPAMACAALIALVTVGVVGVRSAGATSRPADVPIYASHHQAANDVLWSADPNEGTAAGYVGERDAAGQPVPTFRLWSTPPGADFIALHQVLRGDGKHFLTADPSGQDPSGQGPGRVERVLGYMASTPEAVTDSEAAGPGDCLTDLNGFYIRGFTMVDPPYQYTPVDRYSYILGPGHPDGSEGKQLDGAVQGVLGYVADVCRSNDM